MELNEQFIDAVAASKTLPAKPDNDTLLQLYSLYKQSTEGDNTAEPPANAFDFVGKAKHQAWQKLSGTSKEEAMRAYVHLIAKLKNNG